MKEESVRELSREIAQLIVASMLGFFVTMLGTILAIMLYPELLMLSMKDFMLRFLFCQGIISILWYLGWKLFR